MDFVAGIKEILNNGDPIIRDFFLVNSYFTPLVLTLMYVLFVKWLGPILMKGRKPFNLMKIMVAYNFCLVAVYSRCLIMLIYFVLTTDAYKTICGRVFEIHYDDYTYKGAVIAWTMYVLKYVEFADTIFFVLRKKDHLITNLHVIHHASLPICGWVLLRSERSSFQFFPVGINSFIHIIMYIYYGMAAMGPQVKKYLWWKEYLTRLQMLQFVVILFFVLIIIPISGCKPSQHGIFIDIFLAVIFFVLFYNFYTKTYKRSPTSNMKQHLSNGTVNTALANGHPTMEESNGHANTGIIENEADNSTTLIRQRCSQIKCNE